MKHLMTIFVLLTVVSALSAQNGKLEKILDLDGRWKFEIGAMIFAMT